MKKTLILGATALIGSLSYAAMAQTSDIPPAELTPTDPAPAPAPVEPVTTTQSETTTETLAEPTAGGNGAQVLRTQETDSDVTRDADGNVVSTSEPTETRTIQTVSTPSGNEHTLTKTMDADGNVTTSVTHERAERPGANDRAEKADRAERAERPEKAERAEVAERPERPERPEKADRAERPERPDRPGQGN